MGNFFKKNYKCKIRKVNGYHKQGVVSNWLWCLPHQSVPDYPLNYNCCKVIQSSSTKSGFVKSRRNFISSLISVHCFSSHFLQSKLHCMIVFLTYFHICEQHSYWQTSTCLHKFYYRKWSCQLWKPKANSWNTSLGLCTLPPICPANGLCIRMETKF
jgi:hypothetical protein